MNEQKKEYRNIVKGTAIFGGVQIFQILITVIRSKFVALFLGPAGMGVSALLSSTVNTINQISSLGLSMGAMRDISSAHESGDLERLSKVATIFRRLVFYTGVLGAIICVAGAKWWSEIAFGNGDFIFAFILLGVMLFFTALASGETALLQGTRHLKYLAKTSLIGSVIGLLVGVPMYYFWGIAGIAPAMVALAIANYISNRFFASRITLQKVEVTKDDTMFYAKNMIFLGVTLTVSSLMLTLAIYIVNWLIRYHGSIDDVGLYQAATSITTQYIGFVFSAMAVDYFPRLAAISNDNIVVRKTVNQQGEIIMLVAAVIIIGLLVTAPLVIRILLTTEFLTIIPLMRWLGYALFFKATSFALGYISFAKGDKKTFFWLEGVFGSTLTVGCSIVGYLLGGLNGLGVAQVATYIIYLIVVSGVAIKKYQFRFEREFIRLFVILLSCCTLSFVICFVIPDVLLYSIVAGVVWLAVCYYCYREIDKRVHLKELLKSKFSKKDEA